MEGIIYSALAAIALTVMTVILPLIATPRIEPPHTDERNHNAFD